MPDSSSDQVLDHFTNQIEAQRGTQARRRFNSITWIMLTLIVVSVIGVGLLVWQRSTRRSTTGNANSSTPPPPISRGYMGTSDFIDAENEGAYFNVVYPPGSPADKAGLVGGDIITSFDAKTVKNAEDLRRLIASSQAGKTVQVVFIRDGETRTTKLTTVSKNEIDRLNKLYDERSEGYGFMGEGNKLERVQVPGMNIYGVQLNGIIPNQPADQAGMLNGDIVIEFDGIPIRTAKELELRVDRSTPDTTVKVVIIRGQERLEIPVHLTRNYY